MQKLEMTTVTLKSQNNAASSAATFYRQPRFLLKIILYVGTGILQPMIIDSLRMRECLGRKSLLLPTLAKTTGMALIGVLSTSADRAALRRLFHSDPSFRRSLFAAAFVDMVSGMLLTGGILLTGGAVFVVLYNSVPAWTALLSKYFLGRPLTAIQMLGVVIVCLGLMCNIFGTTEQLSSRSDEEVWAKVTMGSVIVLLGCILHSGFFVLSDRSLRGHHTRTSTGAKDTNAAAITPPLWSSCLGSMEATTMATYIIASISARGFHPEGTSPEVCSLPSLAKGFCSMLLIDAVHSAAFFLMLKQIGAVGSALLKGVQSVAVVLLSAAFFCPREEAQCLTIVKALSVALVLIGTFLYAVSSSVEVDQNNARGLSTQKNDLPSVEIESLLE
mmetsp:Transcript_18049/g.43401  ORF Transcript_18049/g.43401 Transcript_18049/m.43401 type:complete len:388 (-) Transcript_18049:165-1328(-)